ncbi:hypothetical protein [Bradyrhizobium niftali]|uniref:Uncharacterized protein n=1 Tax=Bradyrhizobium niftali TaxID=2560055 RepID=A0A4Y9M3N3_9BRAD|nr:hypothetical protein [Bradyrhizobium niftali]TFV49633.1 hypothetical protein E4K65_05380 [Bradyrhizobium niftali]
MVQEVIIQDVTAQVRVLDAEGLLNPRTMSAIVKAVLQAAEDEQRLALRRQTDTQTSASNRGEKP